jgi:hypothetical protein
VSSWCRIGDRFGRPAEVAAHPGVGVHRQDHFQVVEGAAPEMQAGGVKDLH